MSSNIPSKLFDATATIDELKALVDRFVEERSWKSFHSPKNLAMSISIEAAELMEHFQWTNPEATDGSLSHDSPVAQELSDVIAYSLALANVLGIDLSRALESKMARNRLKYPVGVPFVPKGISD
jgi:dCTP diphosphatase